MVCSGFGFRQADKSFLRSLFQKRLKCFLFITKTKCSRAQRQVQSDLRKVCVKDMMNVRQFGGEAEGGKELWTDLSIENRDQDQGLEID